jgi:glycosyltransferase involved in cell wall biosynthesis
MLEKLELESRRYFLYVSRFEPENNPHRVVEAYGEVLGDYPLVMVGGAPYASAFIRRLKRKADSRVVFPGPIYGDGYRELLSHAAAYVHATEVGGTHPALVEAMGYGNCVVVNDTPENREVAGEEGLFFRASSPQTLRVILNRLRQHPEEARSRGRAMAQRALKRYNWDQVARSYQNLFKSLCLGYNPPEVERGPDC